MLMDNAAAKHQQRQDACVEWTPNISSQSHDGRAQVTECYKGWQSATLALDKLNSIAAARHKTMPCLLQGACSSQHVQ